MSQHALERLRLETILRVRAQCGAARVEIIERLATAAGFHDHDTSRHTERVGALAARIAAAVGMPDEDRRILQGAAALHDVGKIGIPDALLSKPAP